MSATTPAQAVGFTPLPSQSPITRPEPTKGSHAYSSSTKTGPNYWSVVAVRPFGTTDLDLSLFDSNDVFLTQSGRRINSDGFADVDFVAIDSNRRPFSDYISRVFRVHSQSVTWKYTVEFVNPGKQVHVKDTINTGINTMSIADGHVADIADLLLKAGQTVTITAQPKIVGQYPELFVVMASTSALDSVVGADQALAVGAAPKPSKPASLTFTAPHAGFYGVILVNKTVPPTGAIPPAGDFKVTIQ